LRRRHGGCDLVGRIERRARKESHEEELLGNAAPRYGHCVRCPAGRRRRGWPGNAGGGKCLPAANSEDGREALEELPWFCLDNCAAMGQLQDWSDPGCLFQGSVNLTHGACVDLSGGTLDCMPGECEETNLVCGASGCTTECTTTEDCPILGFPDTYGCDSGGHCVPPECVNADIDFAYCNLYR
jgi:hypothetical protein